MFKRKTVFITIEFAYVPGLFDYPKHLPLPRIGEAVHYEGKFGRVSEIKYMIEGTVTEIKMICSPNCYKEKLTEAVNDFDGFDSA